MWSRLKSILTDREKCSGCSDEGRIRVSGRDTFDYVRGDHRATVYAELLTGRIKRRICVWSIRKWHPPHDDESMSQQEMNEILSCMRKYFDKRHISYDLLEGEPPSE